MGCRSEAQDRVPQAFDRDSQAEADGFDPKGSRDADLPALREKAEAALRR
jgi:hypothetical protein